jgi:hypothetical protein
MPDGDRRATLSAAMRLVDLHLPLATFATFATFAFAVALPGCARQACEPSSRAQGILVQAPLGVVTSITGADACSDVRIRCLPEAFTTVFSPGCEYYRLLPRRAGTCTLRVGLVGGEMVTHAIEIVDRTGDECENANSYYAKDPKDDGFYVAPGGPLSGTDAAVDGAPIHDSMK